ncbi:MurR/RpiR family transcriptional regulator [Secundilactobacillus malefermentans]|uniref:HTH rpiR-type domain-containing protein n=1 Tax=Secundilactobacillus malefermentans TaxID=176292 RepID=A0A4R5NNW2_9LACO|nr:MurR/RpiR family transcriptional regulator [Secundilactobacillus malefermentans]KRM60213.1 transcriptional regulator [Secundilactobacillus malefermentans DSM 5705 = KCTC 3548]QEA30939.1 MurR/RpiR family transcriptional regulator [Secundilactobacillus malefermentans]TDG78258.1 hypothetical protein C5L31_001444 [Secundilactobacillus malefermentans]
MHSTLSNIRSYFPNLSQTDRKIANYVLKNPNKSGRETIKSLAATVGVSTASISRFVKRVGYHNFREFSVELAQIETNSTSGQTIFKEIDRGDSLATITQKTFHSQISALESTQAALKESELARAVLKIIKSKQLNFFGLGASSIVALDGYHKFLRTSLNCVFHPDYDIQLMQAARMNEDDCAIVISHSGENHETLLLVETLKEQGTPIIGITSFANSTLANEADVTLLSLAEEVNYRSEGMYSLIAQMTIMDTLFMMSAVRISHDMEGVMKSVHDVIEKTRH